jgi:hypothetical protein
MESGQTGSGIIKKPMNHHDLNLKKVDSCNFNDEMSEDIPHANYTSTSSYFKKPKDEKGW